jgi:hypothetical protein
VGFGRYCVGGRAGAGRGGTLKTGGLPGGGGRRGVNYHSLMPFCFFIIIPRFFLCDFPIDELIIFLTQIFFSV